ncbi:hypothetical protein C8Q79DRAFT_348525 [Trametes meyenii]|nr:hypothetical protein C8Q79DRAFT_348525 [Trametes meyenii]
MSVRRKTRASTGTDAGGAVTHSTTPAELGGVAPPMGTPETKSAQTARPRNSKLKANTLTATGEPGVQLDMVGATATVRLPKPRPRRKPAVATQLPPTSDSVASRKRSLPADHNDAPVPSSVPSKKVKESSKTAPALISSTRTPAVTTDAPGAIQTVARSGKPHAKTRHTVDLEYSSAEEAPLSALRAAQLASAMAVSQRVAVRSAAHINARNVSEELTDEEGLPDFSSSEVSDLSDSGDDLAFENAEVVEAELIAEKPLWTTDPNGNEAAGCSKGKGRACAVGVLPDTEDKLPKNLGEDRREFEQGCNVSSAMPKANSNKAGTVGPSKRAL